MVKLPTFAPSMVMSCRMKRSCLRGVMTSILPGHAAHVNVCEADQPPA